MAFTAAFSALRVAVEWTIKDIKHLFSTLDYRRKLKLREGPVGLLYPFAVSFMEPTRLHVWQ